MRLALDTNRYTDLCAGLPEVQEALERAAQIFVPLIVLGELRAGFARGTRREQNEAVLATFLQQDGVSVLAPDEQTTWFYADLYAYLRSKGRPIPTNDIWIAALAVQHSLLLFDRDAHFDALPQLARLRLD